MYLLPTEEKKIEIKEADIKLEKLLIDYEVARRFGGKKIEVSCAHFINESKRDSISPVTTSAPTLRMMITKTETGYSIESSFSKVVVVVENGNFEFSENFVEAIIKQQYRELGFEFEV